MKIELSDHFKKQGFHSAYLFVNNMGRNCVELSHKNKKENGRPIKRFISFAKYLWISHNKQEVPNGYEVDHINGNAKDDRIENLQILSKHDNIIKEKIQNNKIGWESVELKCPVCGKYFTKRLVYIKRVKSQPCCCSLQCSGHLSNMNLSFNKEAYIKECIDNAKRVGKDVIRY
jgi:hypothetical protein